MKNGEAETAKRKRRSKSDVENSIRAAARSLFSERGYAATTTREISTLADVSESLLFRYYGGKAGLFKAVIASPLNEMMQEFEARESDLRDEPQHIADSNHFVRTTYRLLRDNEDLFRSLLTSGSSLATGGRSAFNDYLAESGKVLARLFAARGEPPPMDLDVASRLGFGLIASSVLLQSWLFAAGSPEEDVVIQALQVMIGRALSPRW